MAIDATAGEDDDVICCLQDELTQSRDAGFCCGRATRSEDATDAEDSELFKSSGLVGNEVKGTMEGEGQPISSADKAGRDGQVYRVVWKEGTTDNGGSTSLHGGMNVLLHHEDFCLIIHEIAFTRPDEDVNAQRREAAAKLCDGGDRGCKTVQREGGTEFYAGGAASDGGQGTAERA